MSHTIAQRHGAHVHIPWTPVIAVIAAALVAAAILIIINRPSTTSTSGGQAEVSAVAGQGAVAVPKADTPAWHRLIITQARLRAQASEATVAKQLADRAFLGGPPPPQRAIAEEAQVVSPGPAGATQAKLLADRAFLGGAATPVPTRALSAGTGGTLQSASTQAKLRADAALLGGAAAAGQTTQGGSSPDGPEMRGGRPYFGER